MLTFLRPRFVSKRYSVDIAGHVCKQVRTSSHHHEEYDRISKLTNELFQNTVVSLNQIDVLLQKNVNNMTFHNFALLMGNTSRKKIKLRQSQLRTISEALSTMTANVKVDDIGQLAYSFHLYDDNQPHILSIMEVGNKKLKLATTITARVTENVLFGMRNMSSSSAPVREMLGTLSSKMHTCTEDYSSIQISNSLNGLRCMNSSNCAAELNAVIYEICQKMRSMKTSLNSREVSNSLVGFRGIDSSNVIVRDVLLLLTDHLRHSRQMMHCVGISSSLYGLQNMSSEHVEVRGIIEVLTKKIEEAAAANVSLDNIGVSNVLYGMQNMSCAHAEVKKMMCALSRIINQSKNIPMTANQLSNAIFGLQNMSPCNEVFDIITLLGVRVEAFDGRLNAEEVGKCLLGMRHLTSHASSTPDTLQVVHKIRLSIIHHKPFTNVKPVDVARSVLGLGGVSVSSVQEGPSNLQLSSTVPSIVLIISNMCHSCSNDFSISDIIMILRGIRELNIDNPDVQTLVASLGRKFRRLRNKNSLLLAEKELVAALSQNTDLKRCPFFGNLVSALGLKKRMTVLL